MQRLGCLVIMLTAACGSGTPTGTASLSGVSPAVRAAASETFVGPDAAGTKVKGWTILLYENEAGGDCLEGTVSAKIGIFTTTKESDAAPQALLLTGEISIVGETPPTVAGNAAANMGAEGLKSIGGIMTITEFHLTADAKHADRIKGTITASGLDSNDVGVPLNGDFDAPLCEEN
jgi:hypothetical protein